MLNWITICLNEGRPNGTDLALSRAWGGAAVLLSIIFIIFTIARLSSGRAKG
jgi:ABC-type phosphate transport system permease subunit